MEPKDGTSTELKRSSTGANNTEIYRETELGVLPKEWKISKIGDYCTVLTGGTPKTSIEEYYQPKEIPWMKSGAIKGNMISKTDNYISKDGLDNSNARMLPKNSVVIALSGRGKTRGKTSILGIECACSQSVACIVPNESLDYCFLHYFLSNIYTFIRNITGDKDRSGLNLTIVRNIPLIIPPISEQRKIASLLSKFQEAIEKTDAVIESAKSLKKSMMKYLFTYGAVPVDKAEYVPLKEMEIGSVPVDWKFFKLGDLTKVVVGHVSSISQFYTKEEVGIPILSTKNISDEGIKLDNLKFVTPEFHEENKKSQIFPGDIIVARHGNSGCSAVIPTSLGKSHCLNVVVIRSSAKFDSKFLEYLFNSKIRHILSSWKSGSVQGVVNTKTLESFEIPLPNSSNQKTISKLIFSAELKIKAEEDRKAALTEMYNTLRNDLMTAKLRVKELEV